MDVLLYDKIGSEADRIADLIHSFPSDVVKHIGTFKLLPCSAVSGEYKYNLPHDLMLDFSGDDEIPVAQPFSLVLVNLFANQWGDTGLRKIEIKVKRGRFVQLACAFNCQQYIEKIIFTNGVKSISDFNNVFSYCQRLTDIIGEIDVSNSWVNEPFGGCAALETVTFAKNCIGKTSPNHLSMPQSSSLTNESLVSIANGLYEGAGKTLRLHEIPKATCGTIMGTVAMDASNTYHVFTADVGGNVTLADFITNSKGWTLG